MEPFAAKFIIDVVLRKYHMLILVQFGNIGPLVLANNVRELARESHVMDVDKVLVLLNEKLSKFTNGQLGAFGLALLKHL